MGIESDVADFASNFQQDIQARAESHAGPNLLYSTFTEMMIEYIIEAQELEGGENCYHKSLGMEISGYNLNEDDGNLDLFISYYTAKIPPPSITKTEIETRFRWALGFLSKALDGFHHTLEEASPVFDMAQKIHEVKNKITNVRVYLFTDGQTKGTWKAQIFRDIEVRFQIWDIVRLHRCISSGRQREPIEIDFENNYGGMIPCLESSEKDPSFRVFLALIPAPVLFRIYDKYGPRLLELNVRSFLQARGKVNKGIRNTLLKQPERFLAYNNGISATSEDIELRPMKNGGHGIAKLKNLQIVNGGQTTASIFQAVKKDKAVVDHVQVQTKLTVVTDPTKIAEIVPLISRFANSQNKVNEPDFSANDPFHVRIQSLSRTVWAPATGVSQKQSRWFYERARGQFMDEKNRAGTASRIKDFQEINPPHQRFSKTDLAKYENTWEQLPHFVSLGGQKNFLEFTIRLNAGGDQIPEPTQADFERMIARAIIFRRCEDIVGKMGFGGYRANIVTYTLAYLSFLTAKRIDLDRIWREQDITTSLIKVVEELSFLVHKVLVNPPAGRKNVTEWCKRKECWEAVKTIDYKVPKILLNELVPSSLKKGS